ncbi:hypothetical protein ZHAS_00020977 [Anopheles sinensis]|uniref:Uncharacterized protein n=1 Tax=Anopheles sinensis TaxID=74873 RepID=A0A084WR75_ANOSI|nr:hypothetical protein ZHAS_00020977 [Anopheles sinensis]
MEESISHGSKNKLHTNPLRLACSLFAFEANREGITEARRQNNKLHQSERGTLGKVPEAKHQGVLQFRSASMLHQSSRAPEDERPIARERMQHEKGIPSAAIAERPAIRYVVPLSHPNRQSSFSTVQVFKISPSKGEIRHVRPESGPSRLWVNGRM